MIKKTAIMKTGWYWVITKVGDNPEIAYYSEDVDNNWPHSDPWTFNYTEETKKTDQITVLQRIPNYAQTNS